jgi:hypothetical protein
MPNIEDRSDCQKNQIYFQIPACDKTLLYLNIQNQENIINIVNKKIEILTKEFEREKEIANKKINECLKNIQQFKNLI